MMKRTTILLSLLLCCLCPSQAQLQMFFSADSLSNITSPLDVDSLFYWFAADVAVLDSAGGTISGGEGVGTWTDLGPFGHDVVQADTTKDPRWCASCGPASYPAIVFNGVDEFLASSSHWWGSDDLTVFVVMKFANATRDAVEQVITKYETVSPANNRQWLIGSLTATAAYRVRLGTSAAGTAFSGEIRSTSAKSASWTLWGFLLNGTDFIYKDGAEETLTINIATTIYNSSAPKLGVGAINITGGSPVEFFQGSISEIIIFSRALTATERTAIENYLNRKYDLYYLIILGFPLASARRRKLIPNEKKNAA